MPYILHLVLEKAIDTIERYIKSGYGILTGHDSIIAMTDYSNIAKLRKSYCVLFILPPSIQTFNEADIGSLAVVPSLYLKLTSLYNKQ